MPDGDSDSDRDWWRPVLIGLGALVAFSVLVGGLVAVVALGAVSFAGLGGSGGSGPSSAPSLYLPPLSPTPGPTTSAPAPSGPTSTGPSSPAPSKTKKPKPKHPRISLSAFPKTVGSSQRINLTGVYPKGEGATLQVQRFEAGAWKDFPTTARVSGRIFTTYVLTSRTGKNRFRVLDTATGRASNPVTVTVR